MSREPKYCSKHGMYFTDPIQAGICPYCLIEELQKELRYWQGFADFVDNDSKEGRTLYNKTLTDKERIE